MKVKELAEHIKGVNPEAEFQVFVMNYPQAFIFTHGGGDGCTEETCINWGPLVYDVEHHETEPGRGEGQHADPEKFDFGSLVGMKFNEARETLEKNGFMDYTITINSTNRNLEIHYTTRGEWPAPRILHTVRIEGK